ncbi:MAG TPA: hypothetical protein VF848_03610 [Steroidobacteraceae bacterium]
MRPFDFGIPDSEEPLDEDTTERLLALAEDASPESEGAGFNPYDTYPCVNKTDSTQRNADLRKLSEWIRLKRQVEQLKKKGGPEK